MTPLERFEHLLAMAAADKRVNEAELGFLAERALKLGVTEEEFHDAIQKAVKAEGVLTIPESKADRRVLLKDLVMMMAADGHLDEREKELFAHVASLMEIDTDELHQVIDATIAENS